MLTPSGRRTASFSGTGSTTSRRRGTRTRRSARRRCRSCGRCARPPATAPGAWRWTWAARGVRRELLQERQGRRRRAGVRPAAVGRRRDAGRRAELRRQRQGALRPPVQLRVPQGHGQDEQHRRQDRQPGRDQEEVLQVQLGAVAQSTVNFVIDRVTCPE